MLVVYKLQRCDVIQLDMGIYNSFFLSKCDGYLAQNLVTLPCLKTTGFIVFRHGLYSDPFPLSKNSHSTGVSRPPTNNTPRTSPSFGYCFVCGTKCTTPTRFVPLKEVVLTCWRLAKKEVFIGPS